MKILASLLVTSAALTGCATTPADPSRAASVPPARIAAFQSPIEGPSSTLILTRDKGILGSGCYYGFFINDTLAARIDVAETATFIVPAGELLLRAGGDPEGRGLCALGKQHWTQRETILRDGEVKYFRMSIDVNGETDIQRADPIAP